MPIDPATRVDPPRNALSWTLAGMALGIGLLYASTRQVDPAALVDMLRSTRWVWALAVLGATLSFCAIKAWRWALLLQFAPGARFGALHGAVYAGLAVNFLVSHMGEFLRAAIVARRGRAAMSAVFASVVVERILDFIAFVILLILVALVVPQAPSVVTAGAAISGAFAALAVGCFFVLLRPPAWWVRIAGRLSLAVPQQLRSRLAGMLERFRSGLSSLKSPRLMLIAILASLIQWTIVALAVACSSLAVGEPASLVASTVTLVIIVLGLTLPNSPMHIGTTQLAFVVGLGIGGTAGTASIAASLVYTVFLIVPIMLGGGVVLLRGRVGLTAWREARSPPV